MNSIAQTSSLSDFLRVVKEAKTRTNLTAVRTQRTSTSKAAVFAATFAPQNNQATSAKVPTSPAGAYSQRPSVPANAGKITGNYFDAYA